MRPRSLPRRRPRTFPRPFSISSRGSERAMSRTVIFRSGGDNPFLFEPGRHKHRGTLAARPHRFSSGRRNLCAPSIPSASFRSFTSSPLLTSLAGGRRLRRRPGVFCRATGEQPKGASDDTDLATDIGQDRLKKVCSSY